jgi:hypothetical protein
MERDEDLDDLLGSPHRRKRNAYITDVQLQHGLEMIRRERRALGMELAVGEAPLKILGKDSEEGTPNDKCLCKSLLRYAQVWFACLQICIMAGLYQCAIIFDRENCPRYPVPMSALAMDICLRYLTGPKGSVLTYPGTDDPVFIAGTDQRILCLGTSKSISSIMLFRNAISKVHSKYRTTNGQYQEQCQLCVDCVNETGDRSRGCHFHPRGPELMRQGNPIKDAIAKASSDIAKGAASKPRQAVALRPAEVRKLRHHLLKGGTWFELMLWTLMILGIKGFLRAEENITLRVEDFPPEYFKAQNNFIQRLCMKINGKKDHYDVMLAIFDDNECPELSSMRAILLWIAVSGITSGYIFPCESELRKMDRDDNYRTPEKHLHFQRYSQVLKKVVMKALGFHSNKSKPFIIGTHMIRRTAYLFATWGLESLTDTKKMCIIASARHHDLTTAIRYLGTSLAEMDLVDSDSEYPNTVGKFQAINIATENGLGAERIQAARDLAALNDTTNSVPNEFSLVELADWFTFTICGIPRDWRDRGITFEQLHNKIADFHPTLSPRQQLDEELHKLGSPGQVNRIRALLNKVIRLEAATLSLGAAPVGNATDDDANSQASGTMDVDGADDAIHSDQGGEEMLSDEDTLEARVCQDDDDEDEDDDDFGRIDTLVSLIQRQNATEGITGQVALAVQGTNHEALAAAPIAVQAAAHVHVQESRRSAHAVEVPVPARQVVDGDDSVILNSPNYQDEIKAAHSLKFSQISLSVKAVDEVLRQMATGKLLKSPLRQFMYKVLLHVNCLRGCHDGDVLAYVTARPEFQMTDNKKFPKCSTCDTAAAKAKHLSLSKRKAASM